MAEAAGTSTGKSNGTVMSKARAPFQIQSARACRGYAFGLRQRAVLVDFTADMGATDRSVIERCHARLAPHLPRTGMALPPDELSPDTPVACLQILAAIVAGLEEGAGGVVSERPRIALAGSRDAARRPGRMALPTAQPILGVEAFKAAMQFLRATATGTLDRQDDAALATAVETVLDRLNRHAPGGLNARSLIRAGHELDLPQIVLPGGVIQFGYGRDARLFQSTLSDETSAIGAQLTRDKRLASKLMQMADIPVAEQRRVASAEEALRAAEEIGFPVVVKPADLDQGQGVFAGLEDAAEVATAHDKAAALSGNILVERYVAGDDFRVNVLKGKVTTVVARIPASVTGTGTRSIAELVAEENRDPRRGTKRFSELKKIVIDEDMIRFLARRGLTPDSVPEAGRQVRLRNNANVSTGGHTAGVTDRMHPDTVRLCEDVARLFALDIAGIDLVTPDITKPLAEVGGIVCEVNAQPQVGITYPEVFRNILSTYCPAGGGARIGLLLTDGPAAAAGLPEARARANLWPALLDRDCAAIPWAGDGAEFGKDGVPVDRLHVLAVGPWSGDAGDLSRAVAYASEQLRGPLLVPADHPLREAAIRAATPREVETVPDIQTLAARFRACLGTRTN